MKKRTFMKFSPAGHQSRVNNATNSQFEKGGKKAAATAEWSPGMCQHIQV